MDTPKTRMVFCANEQAGTENFVSVDGNGEWVFTCSICGRILKFASPLSANEVNALLEVHMQANEGQITQDSLNAKIQELIDTPPIDSTPVDATPVSTPPVDTTTQL